MLLSGSSMFGYLRFLTKQMKKIGKLIAHITILGKEKNYVNITYLSYSDI